MPHNVCKEEVYRKVFDQYGEPLRHFLAYKSKDVELAEDLVQDAFHKLWVNCKKVTPEKVKSYLYTVANNLFLNKVKRQGVESRFLQSRRRKGDHETPEYLMEAEEFRSRLTKAIEDLPEDERVVFLMNRLDAKKYREIAEELDISIKTVEKRMHKALKSLRKIHQNV